MPDTADDWDAVSPPRKRDFSYKAPPMREFCDSCGCGKQYDLHPQTLQGTDGGLVHHPVKLYVNSEYQEVGRLTLCVLCRSSLLSEEVNLFKERFHAPLRQKMIAIEELTRSDSCPRCSAPALTHLCPYHCDP